MLFDLLELSSKPKKKEGT